MSDDTDKRPIILAVDDELAGLDVLARELRKRYSSDYTVVTEQLPAKALDDLARWQAEGRDVALVLVDQWMPGMYGADLLGEARLIHPHAKRVMLVSWGDPSSPETLLHSCAVGQIEYFIPKPWPSGPDEEFHSLVADFLREWSRLNRPAFQAVKIVGDEWTPRSFELRDLLHRNGIPAGFYPVGSPDAEVLLRNAGVDASRLPVVVVFGGRVLVDPSERELSIALGTRTAPEHDAYDLAIVGAGPAGLAAAVYGSSEGLDTVVVEREALGGQAAHSTMIRNYLGFPRGISGDELAVRAYQQAWQFGSTFLFANAVEGITRDGDTYTLALSDGNVLHVPAVIVASGVSYRRLGIPELERLVGAGVFYVSVSNEAFALAGEHVFVAGAGNSAGQAALHLAKYARRVTIVSRHSSLAETMSAYLVTEIEALDGIDVMLDSEVVGGDGDQRLREVEIADRRTDERRSHPAAALFVLIGGTPHTEWLPETVARDRRGYLLTGDDIAADGAGDAWPLERPPLPLETSLPGVLAAGDIRHGSSKRVASAVGDGALAVASAHQVARLLRTHAP
jgi:thioredoxin reductase (NADPH)